MLRRCEIHNGEWRNGLRGCHQWQVAAQRAKVMKFKDGYLISTGEPKKHYIESACRHVLMRQGVLGIRVKIMLAHDPEGRMGPKMPMPDAVIVHDPKPDPILGAPGGDGDDQGYGGYTGDGGYAGGEES